MEVDWLIVGAGYTGAVLAERLAAEGGASVLVVDKRDHIAGNAFDEYDDHGVLVHRYGPHIFHTNAVEVWRYLSRFTEWMPYYHRVLGVVHGRAVPVPFNFRSLDETFGPEASVRYQGLLLERYAFGAKVPILELRKEDDPDLRFLGDFIYDNVFLGYTRKQWGVKPEDLDASVTARVPILIGRDDRYFTDTYQAMPRHGYSAMFRRILAHHRIKLLLKTDYREAIGGLRFKRMIYTGPIDEFFDSRLGPLPYRSLRFDFVNERIQRFQAVGQVNYPNEHEYTRITEQKHITGQTCDSTTLIYEYPQAHEPGRTVPYYPVPHPDNRALLSRYQDLAAAEAPDVVFAGRLADYRYYNMDQAVGRALMLARKLLDG